MRGMMERVNRKSADVQSRQMDWVWRAGNCPGLRPEMCCPINVARGLFSCCNKSCVADTVTDEGGGGRLLAVSARFPLHLSPAWCEQAPELPLHFPLSRCSQERHSFYQSALHNPACSSLAEPVVNLITLTICKVAAWSVRYDTGGGMNETNGSYRNPIWVCAKLDKSDHSELARRLLSTGWMCFL